MQSNESRYAYPWPCIDTDAGIRQVPPVFSWSDGSLHFLSRGLHQCILRCPYSARSHDSCVQERNDDPPRLRFLNFLFNDTI